ncbi:hypothetical protein AHiyo8_01090 [Arthrobacter sp. Hiyo8]|uniref:hypothetical protein n=1 Tax=Arthrobacter sp. Hiyo1 TaxID=1588020 RepID=UPI00068383D3|nr:hypothetical protein [Arthrobacter sp. Hiyo1]BAS11806.1 hypothetical protein AHiyo8_01090 [Arthrobacter sp. Hiyo8]GAP61296.1 hypothetical protein AHiyo1_49840 [Arthrobacter sp. Hiyo1]
MSMLRTLKSLFAPRYEVRVAHPVDRDELEHLPRQERLRAVDDLVQSHAVSTYGLLQHLSVKGSTPLVILGDEMVQTVITVKLESDLVAMDLADALRAHLCNHSTVLVVPNDPSKNLEEALRP